MQPVSAPHPDTRPRQAPAASTLIVTLHGALSRGGTADYMVAFANRVARKGVTAVAMMQPGYTGAGTTSSESAKWTASRPPSRGSRRTMERSGSSSSGTPRAPSSRACSSGERRISPTPRCSSPARATSRSGAAAKVAALGGTPSLRTGTCAKPRSRPRGRGRPRPPRTKRRSLWPNRQTTTGNRAERSRFRGREAVSTAHCCRAHAHAWTEKRDCNHQFAVEPTPGRGDRARRATPRAPHRKAAPNVLSAPSSEKPARPISQRRN